MKKKSLKNLKLNKKSVSHLNRGTIKGGTLAAGSNYPCYSKDWGDCTTWAGPGCDSNDCYTTDPGEMGPCTETIF